MSKHTPGPWHVFSVYAQHEVRTPTDTLVAVANDRANARLISAAPDLLEALKAYDAWADTTPPMDKELAALRAQMRAAIAKAEAR